MDLKNSYAFHYEFEADIYYLSSEEGGRSLPIRNGYYGQLHYDEVNWDTIQTLLDKDICNPGEHVLVGFKTANPHYHIGKFWVGRKILIKEGDKTVGEGAITQVFRKDFLAEK